MWNCLAIIVLCATVFGKPWSEVSDAERDELPKEYARLQPITDTGNNVSYNNDTDDDNDGITQAEVDASIKEFARLHPGWGFLIHAESDAESDAEMEEILKKHGSLHSRRPTVSEPGGDWEYDETKPNPELGDYFEGDILGEDKRKRSDEFGEEYARLHPNTDNHPANNDTDDDDDGITQEEVDAYKKEYARLHPGWDPSNYDIVIDPNPALEYEN